MPWIEKCECKRGHKTPCPNEPVYLVRVTVQDCEGRFVRELIRAVCGSCFFPDTPILSRYQP